MLKSLLSRVVGDSSEHEVARLKPIVDEINGLEDQFQVYAQVASLVDRLHRHGILVDGTFIFGFDGDDSGTFDATADLIRRLELDSYTFYFLTPYPGTDYFTQFEHEGRILHRDWSKFDWDHVVVRPKRMTVEELRDSVKGLYQRLDHEYFFQNACRHWSIHRRNYMSWALQSFLISTGWAYYRSPILRD